MTDLLNIDANAKTVKGQKQGYMTAVMYLAPYKTSGRNVCPFAEIAGCWKTCLNTAGRGGMSKGGATFEANGITLPDNAIQRARIWRTQQWLDHRDEFLKQLVKEIIAFKRRAERKGLTPVVRLNGTSDIMWETVKIPEPGSHHPGQTIFEIFPELQFYDYTKIPKRFHTMYPLPRNYHLTLSYSERSGSYKHACLEERKLSGAGLAVVVRDQVTKDAFLDRGAVDFDEHDLRFLDPDGCVGVLKAKGSARKEMNGFVLDDLGEFDESRTGF